MMIQEHTAEEISELMTIVKNSLSMELRVSNADVENTIKMMEKHGFKYKVSWASMELADHTVIDFWKKELIKKSTP
ncbi:MULTISPECIES: hypothetical protein [Bacillales]|uniref:hypothetical protein n=1 Tax=Bacillales TaxID=1385 RepID=UPI0006A7734B|nr:MULTISPECIES: hypothetical protein [Bacillales]OBZ16986.1 hypothetical protein A7975_03565 [Bacillus sp. FJAT-26390]